VRTLRTCLISILAVLLAAHTASIAEEDSGRRAASYVPRLADLMVVIQIRHAKLFYAAKARNWPLADYELEQLAGTLHETGRYYPNTAPPMTLAEEIRSSLSEAVRTKNEAKFDQAFDEMSTGCNRCHGAADRAFIVIRRPSYPSAFSNQQYSPRPSERQK
jgi:hypothetical protein